MMEVFFIWLTSALTWVREAPRTGSAGVEAFLSAHEELVCNLIVSKRKGIIIHNTDSGCERCWFLVFMINSQGRFSWSDATYRQWAPDTHLLLLLLPETNERACLINMNTTKKNYFCALFSTHLYEVKHFSCDKNIQFERKCTCSLFGSK